MAAPLSNGRQRPALRGLASCLSTALQPLERQPAFLHDCALWPNPTPSLKRQRINQSCLKLLLLKIKLDYIWQLGRLSDDPASTARLSSYNC